MDDLAQKAEARESGAEPEERAGDEAVRMPRPRDPERTRRAILDAATAEFVAHGFAGASVNEIAARAQVNKRMLYHYYGKKDDLYLAVLERSYKGIRNAELQLRLSDQPPREAIAKLVLFTWGYFLDHPEFLSLLNTENMLRGRYLRQSPHIRDLHSPLITMMREVLGRGEAEDIFRKGVDPVQLYISIASLGFFYLSNRYTLSTIFERDLDADEQLKERGRHIVEVILGYLSFNAVATLPNAQGDAEATSNKTRQ
jgi:AcrR family transcriptional regulator